MNKHGKSKIPYIVLGILQFSLFHFIYIFFLFFRFNRDDSKIIGFIVWGKSERTGMYEYEKMVAEKRQD